MLLFVENNNPVARFGLKRQWFGLTVCKVVFEIVIFCNFSYRVLCDYLVI